MGRQQSRRGLLREISHFYYKKWEDKLTRQKDSRAEAVRAEGFDGKLLIFTKKNVRKNYADKRTAERKPSKQRAEAARVEGGSR